jgi:hypothetical protein
MTAEKQLVAFRGPFWVYYLQNQQNMEQKCELAMTKFLLKEFSLQEPFLTKRLLIFYFPVNSFFELLKNIKGSIGRKR